MNLKPWFTVVTFSLAASATGCGNMANNAGNAAGNAAGFAANGVGTVTRNVGNAIGNATGLADNRTGTWNGRTAADVTNAQSIQVDSMKKSINVRLNNDGDVDNRVPNTPRVGGFRSNPIRITVPMGWTVNVSGSTNVGTNQSLSIVPYNRTPQAGVGGAITGQPDGTNRLGVTGTGTAAGTNFGTRFRTSMPGQFAIVSTVQGQRDTILDLITVSKTTNLPTINTSNNIF